MHPRLALRPRAGRRLALAILVASVTCVNPAAQAQSFASTLVEPPDRALLLNPARLHVKQVTLHAALDALQENSGIAVAYSPSLLPANHIVTCACDEVTIEEAIRRILAGTGFEALPVQDQLVIRKRN